MSAMGEDQADYEVFDSQRIISSILLPSYFPPS